MTTRSRTTRMARAALSALLIVFAVVLAPAAAALAFFAAALATAAIPLLVTAAVFALAAVCWALVWSAGRIAFPRRRRVVAAVVTVALVALVAVGAGQTVFRPLETLTPTADSQVGGYWDLPTGSRVAYSHVAAEGERRDAPVVRLHGGPGTPGDGPDDLDRALSGHGFDVYVYDQVGSGRSERLADPTEYTVERQVADLESIRAQIGAERMVLVGGSWGATLGAAYAAAHPDRIEALVFTSPGALWAPEWVGSEEGDLWDLLTSEQERELDDLEAQGGLRLLTWSLLADLNPEAAHALVPDGELDKLFAQLIAIAGPAASCHPERPMEIPEVVPGFYANQLIADDQLTEPDPRPALRELRVPVLVLRGECDYKRWEIAREYRDTFADATLVYVPDAGHAIKSDRPEVYLQTIAGFLTGAELPLPAYAGADDPAAS